MSLRNKLETSASELTVTGTRDRIYELLGPTIELYRGERLAQLGFVLMFGFGFIALLAPELAPYDPSVTHRGADGSVLRTSGPSWDHWFGTTNNGRDILSQVLYGARVSVLVGFSAALIAVFIGANVGLISAYFGGWVEDVLMRITDITYGLPFLPLVIVLIYLLGPSVFNIILAIAIIMWRGSARVVRSEVLTQKQRPYVESARAIGSNDLRIMYRHIFPNVLPLVVLYMAFAVAYAVIAEASVAFLGYGDPEMYSWGSMLFEAYMTGAIRYAWWWVIPPGVSIMLFVMSVFFIGRTLEKYTNPELRH